MEAGWVSDAAIAASIAQSREFWSLREHMTEAQQRAQNINMTSRCRSCAADFVAQTNAAIAKAFPGVRMIVFGHPVTAICTTTCRRRGHARGDSHRDIEGAVNRIAA